jgi:small-conductance mechanosensitive channel
VFTSEADAQKAIADGKLKIGDKVTINGVTGTIQQ